jgi:hypothetical protein
MIEQELFKICDCCGRIFDSNDREVLGVNLTDLPAEIAIRKLIAENGLTYKQPKQKRVDKRKKKR